MDLKKLIESEAEKQIKAIGKMETRFNGEAIKMQQELYRVIVDKFIDSLQVDSNGNILFNARNIGMVNDLSKTWGYFQDKTYRPAIIEFAKDLMSIVDIEAAYFNAIGKEFDIVMDFAKTSELIAKQIGINLETEAITAGSYLDRLTEGAQVRDKIADFVLNNVSAKTSFKELRTGLETLVKGDETTNGAMQQYLRTYAYDTFSNVQASIDLNIADRYKFNSFVYVGDIIKDTRDFCKQHLWGVYTRKDIEAWQTQDWAGKNWDVPFEISRGGYNCRHAIRWIPDEAVKYYQQSPIKEGAGGEVLSTTEYVPLTKANYKEEFVNRSKSFVKRDVIIGRGVTKDQLDSVLLMGEQMSKKYGLVLDKLEVGPNKGRFAGIFSPSNNALWINTKYFKGHTFTENAGLISKDYYKQVINGPIAYKTANPISNVMRHEMFHKLGYKVNDNWGNPWGTHARYLMDIAKNEAREKGFYLPSYAYANEKEFFAEVMSVHELGGYLPKAIENSIEEFLKELK